MKTDYLSKAIDLALKHSKCGVNGPFGAVVVLDGKIIGEGWNQVVELNDPTAHAEIQAIRKACLTIESFSLEGAVLYASCEPCPMCLSAIFWSRIQKIYYAASRKDAAKIGFDDETIYSDLFSADQKLINLTQSQHLAGKKALDDWSKNQNKVMY